MCKHAAASSSDTSLVKPHNKPPTRNSSVELLRIIAMFMILAHHFVIHNSYNVKSLPLGWEKIFFQLIMAGGGKIGVIIFFSISAWFLLDQEQTVKNSLRRIWLMEKEVLFWSLCLACLYLIFAPAEMNKKLLIKSFAPLNMNVWWYATAYAIFLALLPFLSKGLKALGRNNHLILATIALIIWGVRSFIPGMMDGYTNNLTGAFGLIYVFILISAYKWYMHPFTTKQILLMIGLGCVFFILYTLVSAFLSLFGYQVGIYIAGDWKLPVIMIGFGLFLLFSRITIHSRIINRIAQAAFGVYLITDYGASEKLLWQRWFNLEYLYQKPFAILQILGILLTIYIICTLIDFARQGLFAITVNRHQGRWFNLLWDAVSAKVDRYRERKQLKSTQHIGYRYIR